MEYTLNQIREDTWIIEDGGVRFFLLAGTEQAALIDSGMNTQNARDIAESLTDRPVILINTHADMDHIAGNHQFPSFYMHAKEEANYRRGGHAGTIIPVREGDVIDLGNRPLEIIELPGHTPGSIAVLDRKYRVLISGDPIQRSGRIFMFGEMRNLPDCIASLKQLQNKEEQFDEIWPSHGDLPVEKELIQKLIAGEEAILAGTVPSRKTEFHGHAITVYDLGFTMILGD